MVALGLSVIPWIFRQHVEQLEGRPFQRTGWWMLGTALVVAVVTVSAIGVAAALEPLRVGDAFMTGLSAVSVVQGLLNGASSGLQAFAERAKREAAGL